MASVRTLTAIRVQKIDKVSHFSLNTLRNDLCGTAVSAGGGVVLDSLPDARLIGLCLQLNFPCCVGYQFASISRMRS